MPAGKCPEADPSTAADAVEFGGGFFEWEVSGYVIMKAEAAAFGTGAAMTSNRDISRVLENRPAVKTLGRAAAGVHFPGEVKSALKNELFMEGWILSLT